MSDYSNLQQITKKELIMRYNLSENQYYNLRKAISARIITAKSLYLWGDEDVPNITQLMDYSLKKRRYNVQQFDIILNTPQKLSQKSKLNALYNYSGKSGNYATGFATFSKGIQQFTIMYSNTEQRLKSNTAPIEKLEKFKIGKSFSLTNNYRFKNNKFGRYCVNYLNLIIDEYNSKVNDTTKENALQFYIIYVRKMLEVINFADEHDAMSGS